jgi:hypothetical protein
MADLISTKVYGTLNVTKLASFLDSITVAGSATITGNLTVSGTITGTLSGNASTATSLQTARTLTIGNTGKTFNGGANVSWSLSEIGAAAASHSHTDATTSASGFMSAADKTKLNGVATGATANTGTVTSVSGTGSVSGLTLSGTVTSSGSLTLGGTLSLTAANVNAVGAITNSTSGNAATATALQTTRSINGTDFNGSASITTANWGTARTLTIGNTGKSVNGSANVAWTLAEIGAYAATNPSGYATTGYVDTAVAELVDTAPDSLNTLRELAAALGEDPNFATTVTTSLGNRLRVDINNQGLNGTQQANGRTNLGLGTAATSNTGDFAAASHTHTIAQVTGLQTALDGKAASSHTHTIAQVTGLQTALDGKLATSGKAADSELIDGIDSSRIVYGGSGSRQGVTQISDWNQTAFGSAAFLSSENSTTNAPTTDFTYGVQTSFHRSGPDFYRTQFVTSLYGNNSYWLRQMRDSSAWSAWVQVIHSGNFNSYAPTLTGGGASGTWGINITGNAATATTLAAARTLTIGSTGKTFNGGASVSWTLAEIGAQAAGSYAAASHTHTIAQVTGLQTALDGKAASSHTHAIDEVTGLQAELDGKQAAGSYAAASHTHTIAQVTGLQTALDGKQAAGSYITNNVSGHLTLSQALKDTSNVRMFMPGGGSYVTTTSVITGAIRIKLPTQGSGMMMTCTVKVYEYSVNKSFTITFGGHRDGANWYNEFCYIDGDKNRGDLSVRFGVSGGKDCVWIGETNSSWSYPQVFVTDFQLGYTGYSATWATGWEVAFATSFDTINKTQTAHSKITTANIGSQSVNYASSAGNADTVDGYHESSFWRDNQDRRIGVLRFTGEGGNSGNNSMLPYAIYQEGGAWTNPFPNLRINMHTGISFGANASYGGYRFMSDYNTNEIIFSVNDGDANVRVTNNLYIGSADGWITDLLDGKQAAGSYAAASHTHTIAQVTGLQTALDGKQAAGSYAAASHTHAASDITSGTFASARLSGTYAISISGNAATATSADQIDGVAFRNTGSNAGVNADTLDSNGITYYTSGVTNFSGNATDGALYSQAYSSAWQHQIAGDYRSGQIALRGKNNGTWQAWRTVLDSTNFSTWAAAASHTHTIAQVTGLQTALDGKAASSHTHTIAQVTGLQTALDGKAASSHTHAIDEVTGLQAELDSKQAAGSYLTTSGKAADANLLDGLDLHTGRNNEANKVVRTQANGYVDFGWINTTSGNTTSTLSDIYVNTNDGYIRKATPAHFRSQITDGVYAAVSHTHTIAQVTGLQTALDGKQAAGSYAAASHEHDRTFITDSRGAARAPSYYDDRYAQWDFQNNSDTGAGGDSWHGLLTVAKWTVYDASHRQEQLAFTGDDLKRRTSASDTTWGAWKTILDSTNFSTWAAAASHTHTPSQVGLGNVSNNAQVTTINNTSLNDDSRNRNGVTRLYRRDDNSDYSVQTHWTGQHWYIGGYFGDGFHAEARVGYADSAGSAAAATSATNSTNANRLDNFGINYGSAWNTWGITNKLVASSFHAASGANMPPTYNYGSFLSFINSGSDQFQIAIPENQFDVSGKQRAMHYRSGWNGGWSSWRQVVDIQNNVCAIVADQTSSIIVAQGVGYNQRYDSNIEIHGSVDEWAYGKFRFRVQDEEGIDPVYGAQFRIERHRGSTGWELLGMVPRNSPNLEWQGDILSGLSDQRVKENVTALANSLQTVQQINAVSFDWKPVEGISERTGHDIGFIAQELELIMPTAVHTRSDGYKTVKYEKVVPVLVQAIKDQQSLIEQLTAKVDALESR